MPGNGQERRDALPRRTALRDYTLEQVLGHGGFGIVYRARHNELGNLVAIKEYLPVELALREGLSVQIRSTESRGHYEDGLRRFLEEARALVGFHDHASIVSCRDFFRANGTAYLVMEYEEGLPLSELLARREAAGRPFAEADLLAVMVPLLEGLARVHEAGALHRDIKPSNVLVRRADERPVLIDFGAAKQMAAERSKSMAPYTEGYAALEQVGEGELGPWTDLYAAGAVMWRMVAGGNRPWEPPNPVKVEKRANAALRGLADPMPPASELGAGRFSPRVLNAIDRCLKLNEKERVRDCGELLMLLRGAGKQHSKPAVQASAEQQKSERREEPRNKIKPAAAAATKARRGRRLWWVAAKGFLFHAVCFYFFFSGVSVFYFETLSVVTYVFGLGVLLIAGGGAALDVSMEGKDPWDTKYPAYPAWACVGGAMWAAGSLILWIAMPEGLLILIRVLVAVYGVLGLWVMRENIRGRKAQRKPATAAATEARNGIKSWWVKVISFLSCLGACVLIFFGAVFVVALLLMFLNII